ncbi:MAG: hypothetical protein NTU89_00160 [Candidatus Dependentiae bacterium]|nr:hypothetical protein [Candidatus Dependentiae bacterium]
MKYVFLSAALFIIPDWFPFLSVPCTLIFLIPLLVSNNSFIKGFAWGLLTCSIKLLWFLMMILTTGCDGLGTTSGVLLWISTIVYLSMFSGLWIWRITQTSRIEIKFLLTITYFGFMILSCMAPFGVIEGYPFFNPLISLAYYPQVLWCVKKIGVLGALSCLILFQLFIAKYKELRGRRGLGFLFSVVFFIPFLAEFFFYEPNPSKSPTINNSNIKYIQPWWYGCKNPAFVGHKMAESINDELTKLPKAKAILMPESTFCFEIEDYQSFVSLWSDKDLDAIIMFGGHRRVGEVVLNSFFMLKRGKIVHVYDKMHLIPFVERSIGWPNNFLFLKILPSCLFPVACRVRHSQRRRLEPRGSSINEKSNDLIHICGQTYQIFICSEFFFEVKKTKGYPIILICNESWLYFEYMKKFMVLFIKYFEVKYDLHVLYATTKGRFSG